MIKKFRQIVDLRKSQYQIVPIPKRLSIAKRILKKVQTLAGNVDKAADKLMGKIYNISDLIYLKLGVSGIILFYFALVIFGEPMLETLSQAGLGLIESLIVRPVLSGIVL